MPWVQQKDFGIFNLIEEHASLKSAKTRSNWFWAFRNSTELKERIRKDIHTEIGESVLKDLISSGRVAYLIPEVTHWAFDKKTRKIEIHLTVENCGTAVALQPDIELSGAKDEYIEFFQSLMPGRSVNFKIENTLTEAQCRSRNPVLLIDIEYATPEGHRIADETYLELFWKSRQPTLEKPFCEYRGKRYYHSSAINLAVQRNSAKCIK